MRLTLCLALLALSPLPSLADTIAVPSRVAAVTLYPQGAQIARVVAFDGPAGLHRLIVPDLPQGTDADSLRIDAPEGLKVGSVSLTAARQPATDDLTRPEVKAAKAEVARLKEALRQKENAVALLRLKTEAADAQAIFLRAIGKDGSISGNATDLKALADMIGAEVLAARRVAVEATQAADAAERALKPDREALDRAQQALAALADEAPTVTLTLTVQKADDGAAELTVLTQSAAALWRPVYDLRLSREGTPSIIAERGVVIGQDSGEDWLGVRLTLSTARPAEQSAPGVLWPDLRRIISESEARRTYGYDSARAGSAAPAAEPAPEPVAVEGAAVEVAGATVTYVYPTPVDLRAGVEELRLSLDTLALTPTVRAEAVPSRDRTAFIVAATRNTTPEVLLPGMAQLWLDGALVGSAQLPLLAAGAETDIGFGPIDGLRLTRTVPTRSQGDSGVISRSTAIDETARIEIENLTGEDWPIRVLDQVPYSEQDDLTVSFSARPKPDETDLDGKRGVLAWDFEIAKGTKQVIELSYRMTWPSGFVLE